MSARDEESIFVRQLRLADRKDTETTPHLQGSISFESIEATRDRLCPEASLYSAILNLSRLWPAPCIWVEAKMAVKKRHQNSLQDSFSFADPPESSLRAVYTSSNEHAKRLGVGIIPRFRVPKKSVISRVFNEGLISGEAQEDLAWWTSSDGNQLRQHRVHVQAKRIGGSIHGLIVPF
jgi:hypothetical protein